MPPRRSCGTRRRPARAPRTTRTSVCSCDASMRPGVNGTVTSSPPSFAACSIAAHPPSTMRSASETFLPPLADALKSRWIPSSFDEHLRELRRLVDLPVLLRREANARTVRATALVRAAERRRRRPRRRDELRDGQPRCRDLRLERRDVLRVDERMIDRRNRVLPDQLLVGTSRPEVARDADPCRDA